eukprot:TRINITY_DN4574_c0_g1_i1.p1 TRINITY_DN4574_c0_g1~~TRINITY_DN4574_c0_g1_i1.p1  ORF type:complete len:310 (+),score=36.98 TRINITY_DN4574_c0_g1_i1:118-1047(+)
MRGAMNDFADSRLAQLYCNEDNTKTTFLVQNNSSLYILQTSTCSLKDAEEVKSAYATAKRLQCLAGSLLKPFSLEEEPIDDLVRISALYRTDSMLLQNLCASKVLDGKTLVETASNLLEAIALLEDKKVLFKEELMLFLDFEYLLSSPIYCSPEFYRSSKEKVDEKFRVYCWGMLVYQLVTKKSIEELKQEVDQYKGKDKVYAAFLGKVKDIPVDSKEKELLVQLLVQALDEEPSNRPSFTELREKFKLEFGECNNLNNSLSQILNSGGERSPLLRDELLSLQNENSKLCQATISKVMHCTKRSNKNLK